MTRERELRRLVESVAVSVDAAGTTAEVLDAALVALCRWSGWPAGHGVLVESDGSIAQSVWRSEEPDRFPEPDRPPALPIEPHPSVVEGPERHDAAIAPRGLADLPEVAGVESLLRAGLEQVCSMVLRSGGRAVGVLHLYSPSPAPDLADLSEVLGSVSSLVGRALDRRRSELVREQEIEQRLSEARSHDPLTGLAHRRLFAEELERALERARRHGWSTTVLAVNVDDFSAVNDRFGPDVGDKVLVLVAERLQAVIRCYDGLTGPSDATARVGSDDFLLLVEHVDELAAATVAQRVLDALAEPSPWSDEGLALTATVGIAVRTGDAGSALAMIADAQAARRHAKRSRSATYEFFAEELRVARRARSAMTADLEQALESGQFVLHYQPQVQVTTGRVVGAEALVRWQHPERGLVPPHDFIPVAESTGLIVPLGSWVLEQACRQAARWRAELPDQERLAISVNVSARQFSSDLVGTVRAALSATELDPTAVVLEVTESVVMDDVDYAVQVLRDLKDLGVSISIDDFGTGYSSLAYLKRLPLDELKIDRSFIRGLGTDPEDTAIAGGVTAMAHALGLQVVAEGVETPLQLDRLRALGCDAAQGYHFSRPVPAAFIPELLSRQQSDWAGSSGGAAPDVVLVADDSPEVRQLAVISLSTAGFDVHEAVDGRAALQLARSLRPDCLVLDVRMPHLTGYEVCRAVREDPRLASCTVVMLTSGAAPQDKLEGYSAGADDYLVKPFTPRELVSRIRHAMNARSAASLRQTRG